MAKDAAKNAGESVIDQFVDINKLIDLAKGAKREIYDVALTRYACYLVAQNGDLAKVKWPFRKRILQFNLDDLRILRFFRRGRSSMLL